MSFSKKKPGVYRLLAPSQQKRRPALSRLAWSARAPQQGASLLEVMVALGIFGIILAGMSQFYGNTNHAKRLIRLRAVQESIANDIENKLKTPSAIYLSTMLDGNAELITCLFGTRTNGCTFTTKPVANQFDALTPFQLAYPTKKNVNEAMTTRYYKTNGALCDRNEEDSNPDCIFIAQTGFYAVCPVAEGMNFSAPQCTAASEFRFAFRVGQAPGKNIRLGNKELTGKRLASIPRDWATIERYFTLSADQILGTYINNRCHKGSVIVGYTRSGQAKCECKLPYVPRSTPPLTDIHGRPFCRSTTAPEFVCDEDMVLRGLNPDGTPDCRTFAEAYECIEADFKSGTCGPGFWINFTIRDNCTFHCTVGKGGGVCESNDIGDDRDQNGMVTVDGKRVRMGLICQEERSQCCRPR